MLTENQMEWLEEAVDKLTFDSAETRCPHCGYMVKYAIVARPEHVEAFERLIGMADKYLADMGGHERMFDKLMEIILKAWAKKAN